MLNITFESLINQCPHFDHRSLYIPSMRKSFMRLYSRLLCAARTLLKTRKAAAERRIREKTAPTSRPVFGVDGSRR